MQTTYRHLSNMSTKRYAMNLASHSPRAVGFFFGDVELSLDLWTVISGISVVLMIRGFELE